MQAYAKAARGDDGGGDDDADRHEWRVGDECRAVWSEDGVIYRAVIDAIDPDSHSCTVTFTDYGNTDEAWLSELLPPDDDEDDGEKGFAAIATVADSDDDNDDNHQHEDDDEEREDDTHPSNSADTAKWHSRSAVAGSANVQRSHDVRGKGSGGATGGAAVHRPTAPVVTP